VQQNEKNILRSKNYGDWFLSPEKYKYKVEKLEKRIGLVDSEFRLKRLYREKAKGEGEETPDSQKSVKF